MSFLDKALSATSKALDASARLAQTVQEKTDESRAARLNDPLSDAGSSGEASPGRQQLGPNEVETVKPTLEQVKTRDRTPKAGRGFRGCLLSIGLVVVVLVIIGGLVSWQTAKQDAKDKKEQEQLIQEAVKNLKAGGYASSDGASNPSDTTSGLDEFEADLALNSAREGHGIVVQSAAGQFRIEKVSADSNPEGKKFRTTSSPNDPGSFFDNGLKAIRALESGLTGVEITGFYSF
jgi:type II secretory pathway pseudopilin PulG